MNESAASDALAYRVALVCDGGGLALSPAGERDDGAPLDTLGVLRPLDVIQLAVRIAEEPVVVVLPTDGGVLIALALVVVETRHTLADVEQVRREAIGHGVHATVIRPLVRQIGEIKAIPSAPA